MRTPWLKPAVWGALLGIVLTMIVGFKWMGWVLGDTAERMAVERADTAVVVALTPSCVSRFMQQPNAAGKLKELQATDTGGNASSSRPVAGPPRAKLEDAQFGRGDACAEQLSKTKA